MYLCWDEPENEVRTGHTPGDGPNIVHLLPTKTGLSATARLLWLCYSHTAKAQRTPTLTGTGNAGYSPQPQNTGLDFFMPNPVQIINGKRYGHFPLIRLNAYQEILNG
jgi:hypothetical protein